MAENGGGQELENLLITVDSEIGNLKGIESAINALQRLQGLTGNAKGAIKQLGDLGVALKNFDGIGSKLNGIDNVTSGVHRMITALQRLTQVTGSATKAIGQLGKLGTTLNSSFNGIGQNLAGIENVSRGVLDLVTAVERLSQVTGNANGATRQLGNLGKSLQSFDNVNLKNVADNIAEPLERIMKAIGNLGNNNTVSIRVDQSGIANVNQINRNVRRTMTTFREFYDTLQTDRANVGQLFGDMFDISQPTEDLQRNLNRAQRMLGTFENSARSNAEKVRTAMSNFATRDLLNNQSFRNAFRASRMNEAMAEEMRTQISNMRSEIETRGQQEINDAWTHVHQAIRANIQHFNLGDYMNFDLPLDQLRANLRRMENELARSQRMMESARTNLTRLRAQTQDVNALHGNEGYRGSFYTYATQTHHIREYTDAIQRLQAVIRRQEIMPQNDTELLRQLPQLTQQLERYQEMYSRMQSVAEPSDEQRSQMVYMERAIDIIGGRIDGIHATLEQIPETEEGILERMRQIADETERTNRAMQQARDASAQTVSRGFGDFGNALSGLNIPVLREIGNLSSLFGRSGVNFLGADALAGLEGIATTLGTVATAIGQVAAVIGVVVAAFQLWWKTMNKVRDALVQFIQSCLQFAKNMLTTVVSAFNAVAGAVSKVVSMVRSGAEAVATAMRKMGNAVQSLLSILGKIGGALAPAMKGVTAVLSTITPRFVKNLASADGSLRNIIKNTRVLNKLLQVTNKWVTMLNRMLMRKIVQAFISGLKQAFEDLVLFEMHASDEMMKLNENVSLIFSGLRRAANQWIAAFEPLINFITPMVVGFLEGVQTMGEAFAKFMAILTGQPYYIRAKLFYQNYGEEVEKANKKVKNLTNGLDELNILNDNKDNDSGIKPEDMFEKVYIDDVFELPSLQEFIDKIVDWLKNIDWEKIWEKIREIIHKAMEIINEILSRLDLWEWLGKTLGNLFNTLMVAWNQFIKDFDPKLLADALTTFIINALQTVNWELIHENIELTAKKFAQFWNEIFGNQALWDEIAKAITNLLNEIVHYFDTWAWTFDFSQMAQTLTDAIIKILTGFDYEQLRHAIEGWVKGLVAFINTAIANKEFWSTLGESLAKIINSVIIEAFKDLGDIDFSEAIESLKLAIEKFIDGIDWDSFWVGIDKWAQNIADVINGIFADDEFLTKVAIALGNLVNGLIELIDESLIKLKAYDIGAAIANALAAGMENIHWNTIFMIPADAINALNNAIRGFLDSLPEDFSLADWLIEHLSLTYDTINWDLLLQNLYEIGDRVVKFINDVIGSDDFWSRFGQLSIMALNLVVKISEDLTQIDWVGLSERITNFINDLINENKIDDIIRNIGDVVINLAFSITAVIKGVDWGELGKQIAEGINGVIDKLYENRAKIRQDIIDAFTSFSTLVSSVLQDLLKSKAFAKLGTIIGEVLLGIINGLSIFFIDNKANIIASMKQFANSLAAYLRAHHDEIVDGLNVIIDALADIIRGFFDSKGELWAELNAILAELNLDNLISAIVEGIAQALAEAFANNQSLWESIGGIGGIVDILWSGVKRFIKTILESLFAKIRANLPRLIVSLMPDFGVIGGLKRIVMSILGFKNGKLDLSDEIEDADVTAKPSVLEKFANKVSNWWNNLWGKDKQTTKLPVEIEPEIDDDTKHQLEDVVGNVELQFEDAKLGKIKADEIEVTLFKGDKLEVEDIYAQTLTVVDIFADKLHVGEIDGDMDTVKKDMEDLFGENQLDPNYGTLSNNKDLTVENIYAQLLDVKKILSESLEVDEIKTELLNATKILTDLLEAKKIKTKLLDAKKIITKLLEAEKMFTKFLEVRDKILTKELEVEEKTTTKILEVDEITLNNDSIGELSADVQEIEKLVVQLIETLKMVVDELEIETLSARELNVSIINANTLNVKDIYAETLTLGTIVADSLKVSSIDGGSISGGSTGGTGITNIGNWGYGGTYTIEKPQFAKGDRWSDISGLVPSAEDFLAGFADAYEFGSDAINDGWTNAVQNIQKVQTPKYLGNNSTGYGSGVVSNGSPITLDDVSLPAEAQYIKDYLTKAIGNEKGALGLLGNLYAESGLRSNNLQDTANTSLGLSDEEYTNLMNNGGDFTDNKGYGLAQWTTDDRKNKLLDYLDGHSVDDLEGQLGYLVKELQEDFPNVWKTLQNASSIHEASSAVLTGFEKPKNQGENQDALRWHYGETIGRALQGTEIPDEDVPTAEVPDEGGDKQVDEFNLIDTGTTDVSGLTGYPFSFLDSLPIQTEFTMAEVYNIIDTWLGRIYKLFKSFKVDDFLKDLLDLKEIKLNVDGMVDVKALDDLAKILDDIYKVLDDLTKKLDELLKKGIECNCTCDGSDDTHLINNTNAKSENTRAVEELNQTIRDLTDSIGDGIKAYVDDITVDIGEIKVDVGDISAIAEATATAEADAWAKALDDLKNILSNITCHCDCDHEIVCQCNCGGGDFDGVIHSIQNALGNITCNCNCNCNCGDCAMGHGGGTNIPDEPTPTGYTPYTPSGGNDGGGYNPTPSTPSGGTGRGGYDPYPYYPIGGGSYDPTPSTPSGGSSGGGNGGTDFMKWIKNGITKPLYVTLDGVRHLVTDTLPDVIKNRILNGEGKYDLDGTPIGRVKDPKASNKDFWLDKIRKWWGKTNQQLKDTDNNLAVWLNHDGLSEMVYAVVDGQRVLLEDNLDDSMKKIIASGVDKLGNKIDFVTDTMNLNAEKRNKVLQWLHQKGWDKIKEATDNLTANADKNADKIGEKVDEVGDEVEKLDTTVKDSAQYLADNADKNADAINGTLDKNKDEINANNDKNTDKLCKNVDDNTDKLDESVKGAKDAILTGLTNGANLLKKGIDDNTNAVNNGANLIKDGVDKSKDAILAGIANGTNVLDKSINGLGGKIDSVKDSVDGLGGKIDGVNNSVIGLGGKLDAINGNVVGLGGKLDGINGNIVGLGGKLDGINGNIVGLGGKLDGINGSILGLYNGISAINDGIGSLGGKLDGINGNIIGIGNTIGGIGGKLDAINGGIVGISNGIGGLSGKLDIINNGISGLGSSIGSLGGKLDSINYGIGNIGSGINSISGGIGTLNNSINNLNGNLGGISSGINNINSGINNLSGNITSGFYQMQDALGSLSKPVTQSVINDGGSSNGNNNVNNNVQNTNNNTPNNNNNNNNNNYDNNTDLAVRTPTGDLNVVSDEGYEISNEKSAAQFGKLDEFLHNRDIANQRVDNMRNEAQQYYNTVMGKGSESLKASAQSSFDSIMKNHNAVGTTLYEGLLEQLKYYAKIVDADDSYKSDNAVKTPAGDLSVYSNGYSITSETSAANHGVLDEFKQKRDEANSRVAQMRAEGQILYDKIQSSGDENLIKQAQSAYDFLMTANNQMGTNSFETALKSLKVYSWQADAMNNSLAGKAEVMKEFILNNPHSNSKMKSTAQSKYNTITSDNSSASQKASAYQALAVLHDKLIRENEDTTGGYEYLAGLWDSTAIVGYATGGFPSSGELYLARENGESEFIGSLGNRNVVANNDQIVTAISNGVAKALGWFAKIFENKTNLSIKGYHMGGTPSAGEHYVARENGTPEFVGSFGGKTAVANNDQIVTAVANGVSMANDRMVSAIENQTNALENAIDRKNLDVQIGDRQIAEANNRGQKGLGNKFVD